MEFEKPLRELQRQIEELSNLPTTPERKKNIARLKGKLTKLQKQVYAALTAWDKLQIARHPERPYTLDYVENLFDEFLELHGDRRFSDDPALVSGLGIFKGRVVAFVGHQKGRTTAEKIRRNFGMAHPEGYRKALRIMKLAESFHRPLICFVDTPGAYPGIGAEERGQAEAIATNILEMSRLHTPIVVIITGEGGSGGALAIAVGDRVFMLEHSIYSVISPEGCASILYKSQETKYIQDAAKNLHITAQALRELQVIDDIIPEPPCGAHWDPPATYRAVGMAIQEALDALEGIPMDQLLQERYTKYRAMGAWRRVE